MKRIYSFFKSVFFFFYDYLGIIGSCQSDREGVLLIRLDAIGDFVIWLDSAKEFRNFYPNKKITVCLNSLVVELAAALPYWDNVISVDVRKFSSNPWYRVQVLGRIRKASFEIAIQPTISRVFSLGDSFIRASRATQRIGSFGDCTNLHYFAKSISDKWYTRLIPAGELSPMELQRNEEFTVNLSGEAFAANLSVLETLKPLPDRLKIEGPYFIVFPGASWSGRQWPAGHFVEILLRVNRQYGWRAVICGGPSEKALCRRIADASECCAMDLSGQTSLPELVEVIRGAEVLIGNETSAVHIATAVATPSVCILGGGHFGRFMPYPRDIVGIKPFAAYHEMPCYNCNWNCTQTFEKGCAVPCVAGVTVANVLQGVLQAIHQSKFTEPAGNRVINMPEK